MVGQGVLRECLLDSDVEQVLCVGRSGTGKSDPKLREAKVSAVSGKGLAEVEKELSGYDACFFCLGVSSAGMSEADYTRITYDTTIEAAEVLLKANPNLTFIYVSGAGTDGSEKGRSMWARVKGRTENQLLKMPWKAYMFRPGLIQPLHGIKSRTTLYRIVYVVFWPLFPLLKLIAPGLITTTERVGRAMLNAVKQGAPSSVFEQRQINALAK
jgi:hypothetical protein